MKKHLFVTALFLALALCATACSGENTPAETTPVTDSEASPVDTSDGTTEETAAVTTPETESETAATDTVTSETEPETNQPETESESETDAQTVPETESETVPETETEPIVLPDGLYVVGQSYNGKYACYNGTYDFGFTVCSAGGQSFNSVQACVDYLATCGGGEIMIKTDLDICLSIDIPDDGNIYKIYYNNYNCDFVFNHGFIYDDSPVYAEVDVIPGLAYYSSLAELDAIGGLENTSVWVCSDGHETLEMGRYAMLAKEDGDSTNYHYEKFIGMNAWYGLMDGEILPEA